MEAQRTLEWYRKRLGCFTGSRIGDLMKANRSGNGFGECAMNYIYQLAGERMLNPLLFEDDEDTETVQVVTTVRCDPLSGRISCKAPLGKALLGRKAGDEVSVTTEEGGSYTVRIKSITNEEGNGDDPNL